MSKENLFVSFSGGRTSAYMAWWLKKNYSGEMVFVFANTGKEREETLNFIDKCDKVFKLNLTWVEYNPLPTYGKANWFKIVDYKTASRNGEPFRMFIQKERIPNMAYPNCSGRLKSLPMHNFIKHGIGWKKYKTAIGIRYDEKRRINWEAAKKNNYYYPLATDHRVDESFIRHWWDNMSFDLELKDYEGNCDFCWKKSDRKLVTLIRDGKVNIDWWIEQEANSDYTFFRNGKSALDLIEMAKDERIKSVDDKHISNNQMSLYDPLDIGQNCFCEF